MIMPVLEKGVAMKVHNLNKIMERNKQKEENHLYGLLSIAI